MAYSISSDVNNPITGVFGNGQVAFFPGGTTTQTYTWTIPPAITAVRARCWGGGGYLGGSGGGFAMKVIQDLTGVTSVTITAGLGANSTTTTGGTSSFGSFVSATGGATAGGAVGAGSGGDVNNNGGFGFSTFAGGGAGGIFGYGGNGANSAITGGGNGNAGGGGGGLGNPGGNGFLGSGGFYVLASDPGVAIAPTSGLTPNFSIDFIGCGGGAGAYQHGVNGGGGAAVVLASTSSNGGFPGGGMGQQNTITTGIGGPGLVIVEW